MFSDRIWFPEEESDSQRELERRKKDEEIISFHYRTFKRKKVQLRTFLRTVQSYKLFFIALYVQLLCYYGYNCQEKPVSWPSMTDKMA